MTDTSTCVPKLGVQGIHYQVVTLRLSNKCKCCGQKLPKEQRSILPEYVRFIYRQKGRKNLPEEEWDKIQEDQDD